MKKKFRLPRKEKKFLKKHSLTYPLKDGGYLSASPEKNQNDYDAYKRGELIDFFKLGNNESKTDFNELDKEIFISDKKLKEYICNMITQEHRASFLYILLQAKNHEKAKLAYFNFINAYHKVIEGDHSYGNICCLSFDLAKKLLK